MSRYVPGRGMCRLWVRLQAHSLFLSERMLTYEPLSQETCSGGAGA